MPSKSEYDLTAAYGSWGSRREGEQQSLVDRLLLTQLTPPSPRRGCGGPGSWSRNLVILDLGLLKVHSLDVVGAGDGGDSLVVLFCIFNSVGYPFLE